MHRKKSAISNMLYSGILFLSLLSMLPLQSPNVFLPFNFKVFVNRFVRLHQTLNQSFVVTNTGDMPLTISSTSFLSGDSPGEYAIARLPVNPIPPGGNDTVTLGFSPTAEGPRFAVFN